MHAVTGAVLRRMPRTIFRATDRRRCSRLGAAAATDVPEMDMLHKGTHPGLLTAAQGARSRPADDQNAPVGSWALADASGACLRARSAAVTRLRRRLYAMALVSSGKKKENQGDMFREIDNTMM